MCCRVTRKGAYRTGESVGVMRLRAHVCSRQSPLPPLHLKTSALPRSGLPSVFAKGAERGSKGGVALEKLAVAIAAHELVCRLLLKPILPASLHALEALWDGGGCERRVDSRPNAQSSRTTKRAREGLSNSLKVEFLTGRRLLEAGAVPAPSISKKSSLDAAIAEL